MSSIKDLKLASQSALQRQEVIAELDELVKAIERSEKTIVQLKGELEAVNVRHQNRKSTRDDIDYLTDLLGCAKRKYAWEKQIASLQKRTPVVLEKLSAAMNDSKNPPGDSMRDQMLRALKLLQAAMERLQAVKVE